jgi:hypothetical protein
METPAELEGGPTPVEPNVQPHVSIMRRLKSLSLKKLFLAFVGETDPKQLALLGFGKLVCVMARFLPEMGQSRILRMNRS